MRIITDIFDYCAKILPKWNTISISGYHIREAGSTAVQEVAFTLADGIAYVDSAIKAGLDPNVFGQRLSFFFAAHNDLFEEVAKFRAARFLWAKIMKERFGVNNPKAMQMRFHTQTGGSTLTAQQPENNIIRVAIQALSSVLGGTQSLHTNSYDEALALPTEESVRIALRTQQIIANESGAADTVDPLGGSYFVESLTEKIIAESQKYISRIDEIGGMVKAIETGFVQKEIMESAYKYQMEIEENSRSIVGLNIFSEISEDKEREILRLKPELERKQAESLRILKANRDKTKIKDLLSGIKNAAEKGDNLMPHIYSAVKEYATIGEITYVLSGVFGEYTEAVLF